jgi:signal transduction histidine kinase
MFCFGQFTVLEFSMKRILILLSLLGPIGLLILFALYPALDPSFQDTLFHFYIVTFSTFVAAVVAIFALLTLRQESAPRHTLLAAAFAAMGAIFLIHGLTTPGVLILSFHPGVQWASWLTLFAGSLLFALAALDRPHRPLPHIHLRLIIGSAAVACLAFIIVAALLPYWLTAVEQWANPWLVRLIFFLTLVAWALAAFRLWQTWRVTQRRVDGVMALIATWFMVATVSLHEFPVYHLSWWLYHVLILLGAMTAMFALAGEYEQLRRFNLTRYYAVTSLIITATLALLTSYLFAQAVYNGLVDELEQQAIRLGQNLVVNVGRDLPEMATTADLRRLATPVGDSLAMRLTGLDVSIVTIYDDTGTAVYRNGGPEVEAEIVTDDQAAVSRALSGQATTEIIQANFLYAYVPIYPLDASDNVAIGALLMQQPMPGLRQAVVHARSTGLLIAALSMGLLFLALLVVVRRADHLITARNNELARAYADLRAAETMRDDLTDMIVHDLRSPLTAITANLDLLGRVAEDPAHQEIRQRLWSNARHSAQRMIKMINDMLDLTKLEAHHMPLVTAPLAVSELLYERAQAHTSQAEVEEKHIAVSVPDNLPRPGADATLIGRVLDNLISNALKYTRPGGHVTLAAEQNGTALLLSVADDGEGIAQEYAERIFDKFFQVTAGADRPQRSGTGLGLAFCKLVVEAHGGRIWVEGRPGQGSKFIFTVPLATTG